MPYIHLFIQTPIVYADFKQVDNFGHRALLDLSCLTRKAFLHDNW